MSAASRRSFLQIGLVAAACACAAPGLALAADPAPTPGTKYVCPPCGCAADGKEFDAPGSCPECGMPLVPKPAPAPPKAGATAQPKLGAAETSHGRVGLARADDRRTAASRWRPAARG